MFDTYDASPNISKCRQSNESYRLNEPTYVNETQLLFFNNDIINIYQRPEFPYDSANNDQAMRYIISRSDDQWHRYRAKRETEAAVIIQRAYRLFRLRRQTGDFGSKADEGNNYIELWDEPNLNALSEPNACFKRAQKLKIYEQTQFRNDFSTPSPPSDWKSKPPLIRETRQQLQQQHHSHCPLSKPRKQSVDLNRLPRQTHTFVHSHNNCSTLNSPHSVIVYEDDLRNINPNVIVVRSCDQTPLVMTINSNCPTHKVYHHINSNHNAIFAADYPQKIVTVNSHCQPYIERTQSSSPDDTHRSNLQRQQSKIVNNQRLAAEKRLYRIGLNIFNKNPAAGINYLIKYQYIKAHPSHIAKFLLTKSGISRSAIGDYIGSISDPLALQVTKFFLRRINMKNKEVDESLRSFIYYVHLPGESQKICHLMEEFKAAYIQQNESRLQFKSSDTIMVLAYAIIMLQTDAHNQSIRKSEKMTLEQFVNNLRGVDDNTDIDRRKLENIYTRITGKEMKTQPDHTDQVRRLNDIICGSNKPNDLVNRIRRFMCYCRLSEIMDDEKKNKSDAHQREAFLFNDILLIAKLHNKSRKDDAQYQCKYSMALTDLRVKLFSTSNHPFGIQLLERKTNEIIIKLNAQCEQDQKKFMFDLSDCIFESLEMQTNHYSDFLSPSSSSQIDNSPKTNPSHLASNLSDNIMQNIIYSAPNPPRRQESLDGPDVIQSLYRKQSSK